MRPLWRWTVGPCISLGVDLLVESVRSVEVLYPEFDRLVCFNGFELVPMRIAEHVDVRLCDGEDPPFPLLCGHTLWKVRPPRIRLESHEVVCDNDLVLMDRLPQVDEFLSRTDATLVLEEQFQTYGRYTHCHPSTPPFLNSGLYGMPPRFDLATKLRELHDGGVVYTSADEQGLVTRALTRGPHVVVPKESVPLVFRTHVVPDSPSPLGYHFAGANRRHSPLAERFLVDRSTARA